MIDVNRVIGEEKLSLAAIGVLMWLAHNKNVRVSIGPEISKRFSIGRDKTNRLIKELISAGYISREQRRLEDGTMGESVYTIPET